MIKINIFISFLLLCTLCLWACKSNDKVDECAECDLSEIDGHLTQMDSSYIEKTDALINGELSAKAIVKIKKSFDLEIGGSIKPKQKENIISWVKEEIKDEFPKVKDYARWNRGVACSIIKLTCKNSTFSKGQKDSIYLAITNQYYEEVNKKFQSSFEKIDTSHNVELKKPLNVKPIPKVVKPSTKSCSIIGLVKKTEDKSPLESASIIITCDVIYRTITDKDGYFELNVPRDMKGDRCMLSVSHSEGSKELYVPICDPNIVEIRLD